MDESVELSLRTEALRQKSAAGKSINRGVAMILFVPIIVVASSVLTALFDSLAPVLFGAFYTIVGGIAGIVTLAFGIAKQRLAARELRELDATRQLPMARVVR